MDLASHWPLSTGLALRDELIAAYGSETRGYHDQRHLNEVFVRVGELAATVDFDRAAVILAAWFHDGVYDGQADAEERSAVWAELSLAELAVAPDVIAEVARLVRLTAGHHPESTDPNGCALSDADLAILASPPERYAEYCADVRKEYADVPDNLFRQGRAEILNDLLAKPTLFHTAYALESWEARARKNVAAELRHLTEG